MIHPLPRLHCGYFKLTIVTCRHTVLSSHRQACSVAFPATTVEIKACHPLYSTQVWTIWEPWFGESQKWRLLMISPLDSGSFYGEQEVYSDSIEFFVIHIFHFTPPTAVSNILLAIIHPKLSFLDHIGSFGVDLFVNLTFSMKMTSLAFQC